MENMTLERPVEENNGLGKTLVWGDQWFGAEQWLGGEQWLGDTNGMERTCGMEKRVVDRIRLINSQSKHLLIGHALLGAMRHCFLQLLLGRI